jgi:1-acyl-sn-glycerol-3-phosphate acyltransferase
MVEQLAPLGILGWSGRLWRLFGTAVCFTVFGLGGLVLGILVFPFFLVLIRNQSRRQFLARKLIGGCLSAFIWIMKSLGVISYEIHGADLVKDVRRTLIIANHPSLIDVVFLASFFPQSECVVKRAVTQNPFTGGVAAAANYISNSDPELLLTECIERLRAGSSLILFPEGTRRDQDGPKQFKLGAAAIAVRADARILPIIIECRPPTLRKREPWYHIPRTRPHWRFEIRRPRGVDAFIDTQSDPRLATRKLQAALIEFYETRLPLGPRAS